MSQTTELTCGCDAASQVVEQKQVQACHVLHPRVDIAETGDAWLLRMDMPGVDQDHAEVTLERSLLTVCGLAALREPEGLERRLGSFRPRRYERSFRLPETIDRSSIEATVQNGVLTVRVPKAAETQPTKVAVKGG